MMLKPAALRCRCRPCHGTQSALLRRAVDMGASDVHLKLGQPPVVRMDGDLEQVVEHPPLTEPDLESVLARRDR